MSTPSKPRAQAQQMYRAGLAALDRGEFAEAARLLTDVSQRGGLPAVLARYYAGEAHRRAGLALMQHARYREAAVHLRESARLNPDAADLAKLLAACHLHEGSLEQAAVQIERITGAPTSLDTDHIRLAYIRWRQGQPQAAIHLLEDAIRSRPQSAELPFHLGVLRASLGETAQAVELLTQSVALAPDHFEAHRHLGLALAAMGDVAGAEKALACACRLRPRDAAVALELCLARQANPAAGRIAPPEWADAPEAPCPDDLNRLAGNLALEPELAEALIELPDSPNDSEFLRVLADAITIAIHQHPEYADLHHYAARVAARCGRLDDAARAEETALKINPRCIPALIHAGELLTQMQRYEDAIDRYQRAIASGGDYPDVNYRIGELHCRVGRRGEARAYFERALQLNADYADAHRALASIAD